MSRVLDRVNVRVGAGGLPPLVIFALDGTLFDPRPRTLRILHECAATLSERDPEAAAKLSALELGDVHRLLGDTLRTAEILGPNAVRAITQFWHPRYHDSAYVAEDVPEPGAAAYARTLHEAGARLAYWSARDVPSMLVGSIQSLLDHGFPLGGPGVSLAFKPDATMSDEEHLRATLPELARGADVVATFHADLPACEIIAGMHGDAIVGLMDTWEFEPPDPSTGLDHLRDFRMR